MFCRVGIREGFLLIHTNTEGDVKLEQIWYKMHLVYLGDAIKQNNTKNGMKFFLKWKCLFKGILLLGRKQKRS